MKTYGTLNKLWNVQGDPCTSNSDESFLEISPNLVEIQKEMQKKQNLIGFHLIPRMRKSVQ